jgi:hypothetical protein
MTAPRPKLSWTAEELDALNEAMVNRNQERLLELRTRYVATEQDIDMMRDEYKARMREADAQADKAFAEFTEELERQGYDLNDPGVVVEAMGDLIPEDIFTNLKNVFAKLSEANVTEAPHPSTAQPQLFPDLNVPNFFEGIGSILGRPQD